MDFEAIFEQYKAKSLHGRYITLEDIEPVLFELNGNKQLQTIGYSVEERPIYSYQIGQGKAKMLLWSQMHGNESTTTKALFDFLFLLNSNTKIANRLLEKFTFLCLPMVNPDGAKLYTRENANQIDLNRDAQALTQPESKALRAAFDSFAPDFCYNLHDQRTIFGAGDSGKPATVSFLSPSYNSKRDINENRLRAMNVIAAMNDALQPLIPGQVGRFDDSFNINCIGDTFQSMKVPTILFEAGHFQNDYEREQTRKFIFIALLSGIQFIDENVIVDNRMDDYLNIPQNKIVFYDIVYKNVKINYDGTTFITNFAVQLKEELFKNKLCFNAYIVNIGDLKEYCGHFEYDAKGAQYSDDKDNIPKLNQKAGFKLNNDIKIVNGMIKN